MRNDFCTLFDVNYLARALVLHRSLVEACGDDFTLRAYCMDGRSEELLSRLAPQNVVVVPLAELERADTPLLATKTNRSPVEYCWTATPAICLHALRAEPELEGVTYLDADLMFFSDPAPLWDEIGPASVAIVPHRYVPRWQWLERVSGTYNVEWVTFRNDERGRAALEWWRERCLEWCYARHEDGKFGDQKYLDDWPERFSGVHVVRHPGGGLAPWNVERYELRSEGGRVLVDAEPLVFFHFHQLRLFRGSAPARRLALLDADYRASAGVVWKQHGYPVAEEGRRLIWEPYLRRLQEAVELVRTVEPSFAGGLERVERLLLRRARDSARYRTGRAASALRGRLPRAGARRP